MSNDPDATGRIAEVFRSYFTGERVVELPAYAGSEDFGSFGTHWGVPSVFWFIGGTDPTVYRKAKEEGRMQEIPTNHNPRFAPVIHPTMETGVEALIVGAQAWLSPESA